MNNARNAIEIVCIYLINGGQCLATGRQYMHGPAMRSTM